MHGSLVTGVAQPRLAASTPARFVILAAALIAIGFFVNAALPYLMLDQQALARYGTRQWWLLLHIIAGAVALLTGPVQLWLGVNRRAVRMHRRLGLAYVSSVAISSLAAFYLAAHTDLGWVFGAGITGLGIAWIVTTTLAIVGIRGGSIEQHQEWMVRSYVVTFGFVTFRAFWTILQAAEIGTLGEQLGAASWFCWAVPLLVTEVLRQRRRLLSSVSRSHSISR
jgi:uncharacterized membrane protein